MLTYFVNMEHMKNAIHIIFMLSFPLEMSDKKIDQKHF